MAKVRAYIRVAKNGYRYSVDASAKANNNPLHKGGGYSQKEYLPTIAFAVDLNIPDELFSKATKVIGEFNLQTNDITILGEVPTVGQLKREKKDK